jgi:hypothetical protein
MDSELLKREILANGDELAMEAAVCFLELRPYFFRSGYLFQSLLRKTRRAPLTESQRLRYDAVVRRQELWRKRKQAANEVQAVDRH